MVDFGSGYRGGESPASASPMAAPEALQSRSASSGRCGEKTMKPFRSHRGRVAPLDRVNVDTDQIIPKQFLKRIERTGFGEFLFYDWRFAADGKRNSDFVLDEPRYAGASILVVGRNF